MRNRSSFSRLLGSGIALGRLLAERGNQRLVETIRIACEVLIPAHEFGKPAGAGRKARGQRVESLACGGLQSVLRDVETIVEGSIGGSYLLYPGLE